MVCLGAPTDGCAVTRSTKAPLDALSQRCVDSPLAVWASLQPLLFVRLAPLLGTGQCPCCLSSSYAKPHLSLATDQAVLLHQFGTQHAAANLPSCLPVIYKCLWCLPAAVPALEWDSVATPAPQTGELLEQTTPYRIQAKGFCDLVHNLFACNECLLCERGWVLVRELLWDASAPHACVSFCACLASKCSCTG